MIGAPAPGTFSQPGRLRSITAFNRSSRMGNLLYYAIIFLAVAVIAAFFGFGGVAGTAMEGARILFWVAIILFVIVLIGGLVRRG
jgi:uncharacterized membrane protein YtjA (UPF0391 family)